MLSDTDLGQLLAELESDRVERKESITDTGRIRQAICAFANDMPGHQRPGVVFVGVQDDGGCANLSITDQLLLTLSDMRSDGRIEIQNPGGPFGQVTVESFGQPGITDYRNPTVAEVMRNLDFVQRFGVGISIARQEVRDNNNPELELVPETNHVLAIVRKHT